VRHHLQRELQPGARNGKSGGSAGPGKTTSEKSFKGQMLIRGEGEAIFRSRSHSNWTEKSQSQDKKN